MERYKVEIHKRKTIDVCLFLTIKDEKTSVTKSFLKLKDEAKKKNVLLYEGEHRMHDKQTLQVYFGLSRNSKNEEKRSDTILDLVRDFCKENDKRIVLVDM